MNLADIISHTIVSAPEDLANIPPCVIQAAVYRTLVELGRALPAPEAKLFAEDVWLECGSCEYVVVETSMTANPADGEPECPDCKQLREEEMLRGQQ